MSQSKKDKELRTAIEVAKEAIDVAKYSVDRYQELEDIAEPVIGDWLEMTDELERHQKFADAMGGQDRLQWLVDEARKFLAIQERNINAAKRPRTDALSQTIKRIMHDIPNATPSDVLAELRLMADVREPPIEFASEKEIEWTDKKGCARTTPTSSLKNRIYRLRNQPK